MSYFDRDFILKDSEFEHFGTKSASYSAVLEETLDGYDAVIGDVLAFGVPSGQVHDAIAAYRGYVIELKRMTAGIGKKLDTMVKDFITTIEKTDQYLYDAKVSSVARDFSQAEYEKLMHFLTSYWYYGFGDMPVWDFITKAVRDFVSLICPAAKEYFQKCSNLLMDQNNEAVQNLTLMFQAVHNWDKTYGSEGGGHFGKAFLAMEAVALAIRKMDSLFAAGGTLTAKDVHSQLGPLFRELSKLHDEVMDIRTISSVPNEIEIGSFAGQPWSAAFFGACLSIIAEFQASIDWMDMLGIAAFQHEDINMGNVFGGLFYGEDVNAYNTRKYLMSVLNKMAETKLYSDSEYHEQVENFKELFKLFKKYGSEYYKYANLTRMEDGSLLLDGRTIPAKQLKQFNEQMGSFATILKYGDQAIDLLSRAFADYTVGLELLDSLERNCGGDEVVAKALSEIRDLYNNGFDAWLKEAAVTAGEEGIDIALKKIGKAPVFQTLFFELEATQAAVDTYGAASGLGDRAKGIYDFTIYNGLYTSGLSAYQTSLEALRAADPDSPNYAILANDVKNNFELCKANAIKMFESMETASMSNKKAYYRYCKNQVEMASMFDDHPLEIMSYEDYLKIETGANDPAVKYYGSGGGDGTSF